MYSGRASVAWASSWRVLVDVVDDGPVDVPADEVDRGEGRHRAARVRPNEALDQRGAVLLGELRRLVQQLEADAVAREARGVGGADHDPAEPFLRVHLDELDERRVGLLACDELGPDDDVRWIEEVQTEEVLPKRIGPALSERVDRKAARDAGDDRIRACAPCRRARKSALDLEVLGDGLEDEVGLRDGGVEVAVVVAHVDPLSHRARPHGAGSPTLRPCSALSLARARKVTFGTAVVKRAPLP